MSETNRLSPKLLVSDVVALATVTMLAMSPFADAFNSSAWLVASIAGLALGVGCVSVAMRLRWGALRTSLLLAVAYLAFGTAFAVPELATARVLPSLDSIRALSTGLVQSWRVSLTLPTELDSGAGTLIVPFVTGMLGGALTATFLWRSRWPSLAGLVVLGVFVTAAAFGTSDAGLPVSRGIALVVLLLVWLRWRSLRSVQTSWARRFVLTGAVVTAASLIGWGLVAATAGTQHRQVLREHVDPPLDELAFKSPLARFRDFHKNPKLKDSPLFTVTGAPQDALVRLAVMDTFDGVVWNVSTANVNTGTSAFRRAPASSSSAAVAVDIEAYTGPWVPVVGAATGASLAKPSGSMGRQLLLNTGTGTVAQVGDVSKGDRYLVDWQPRGVGDKIANSAMVDSAVQIPPAVTELGKQIQIPGLQKLADQWISASGARSDLERARALESQFQKGYFNDGLEPERYGESASGHGMGRIAKLVDDPDRMIGDDEQYASAMAFAAQRLGMPARVVLGFESLGAGGTVTGAEVSAWVEIAFENSGWIVFNPTPDEKRKPPPQLENPNPEPQPYVVQPPVLPQEPPAAIEALGKGGGKDFGEQAWEFFLGVLAVLWWLLKALLVTSPLWGVLLAKRLRRRRRQNAEDPIVRLSGGWKEVTDQARDLGARLPMGSTRHETGVALVDRFAGAQTVALASRADQHVFGPVAPTEEEVEAYWQDVETALARMRADVPWWRRLLGYLSPRSLPWRAALKSGAERIHLMIAAIVAWGPAQKAIKKGTDYVNAIRKKAA